MLGENTFLPRNKVKKKWYGQRVSTFACSAKVKGGGTSLYSGCKILHCDTSAWTSCMYISINKNIWICINQQQ